MSDIEEGRSGVGPVEAFSDGVIAIIVTIMVLELHPPHVEGWQPLLALWPTFLAYVISFVYVAIYWVNHHRLFGIARRVSNGLVWSNMLLLFALSLIPFTTAYMGDTAFARGPGMLYLASLLLPALSYSWLQSVIGKTGSRAPEALRYWLQTGRKGMVAVGLYISGFVLTAAGWPWLGLACAGAVALLWLLPDSRLNALFTRV